MNAEGHFPGGPPVAWVRFPGPLFVKNLMHERNCDRSFSNG